MHSLTFFLNVFIYLTSDHPYASFQFSLNASFALVGLGRSKWGGPKCRIISAVNSDEFAYLLQIK